MEEHESHSESTPNEITGPTFGVGSIVNHPQFGHCRVIGYETGRYALMDSAGAVKRVAFHYEGLTMVELAGDPDSSRIRQAVREVLGEYGWVESNLEMGTRWRGGTLRLDPGNVQTQSKEIPMEAFFKKIIGIREKLRVLEQKINNHSSLSSEEKLELESYITRCYGSLTSFNSLFAHKAGHFVGQSKSKESGHEHE